MGRKRETVIRDEWGIMLSNLDGDIQEALTSELETFLGGDACMYVEYTPDSMGQVDSMSAPCPGNPEADT